MSKKMPSFSGILFTRKAIQVPFLVSKCFEAPLLVFKCPFSGILFPFFGIKN